MGKREFKRREQVARIMDVLEAKQRPTNDIVNSSLNNTKKNKENKKDRHMKCLSELAQFIEKTNEDTVQEVLLLKRILRETLETFDEEVNQYCLKINEKDFLLEKNENDLQKIRQEIEEKISYRSQLIHQLGKDLDQVELNRVECVGKELKDVVDRLVAIAYQLPDDIERVVANEAFDVNQEVITNRVSHTKAVGELRVKHIRLEAELIQRWENTKTKWRQVRHEKAIEEFRTNIRSAYYNDPDDRKQFLKKFCQGQRDRKEELNKHTAILLSQTFATITVSAIADIQQSFNQCNEAELGAIQACYNGLAQLQSNTDYLAKERVEACRKELHLYGALKVDPKLPIYARQLEVAFGDETLAELWRLGGGLKPDLQLLVSEMCCEEIVYDRVIQSMKEKITFILSSFPLKSVLEERGRLAQLDKIRNLITKMRSAPRADVADVLKSLLPEIEDIATMEQLSAIFVDNLKVIIGEMKQELENYEVKLKAFNGLTTIDGNRTSTAALPIVNRTGTVNTKTTATAATAGKSVTFGGTKTKNKKIEKEGPSVYIDPMLMKGWHKQLGILFYGSDLPENYQTLSIEILKQVEIQGECNILVDEVIQQESEDLLRRMDRRYKKLVDQIISYLETQATLLNIQSTNLCSFYSRLARIVENHRNDQNRIDRKSTEELWDIKEEYRIALEDCENEYQQACQKIRECTKEDEIEKHFEEVIEVLEKISHNYRDYHKHACFSADKYPLWLIDEFRSCLINTSQVFFMHPDSNHSMLRKYEDLFDSVERLNSGFFEDQPDAAGIVRSTTNPLDASAVQDVYVSPLAVSPGALGGNYSLSATFTTIYSSFSMDAYFAEKTTSAATSDDPAVQEDDPAEALRKTLASTQQIPPHESCPWMRSTATVLPVDMETLEQMDPDDREEYENLLAKHFAVLVDDLPPPEAEPVPAAAAAPKKKGAGPAAAQANLPPAVSIITPGVYPSLSQLSLEDRSKYASTKDLVDKIKARLEEQHSSDFILQHPPCDSMNIPWVEKIEISSEEIKSLFESFRQNLVTSLEDQSYKKLAGTERTMTNLKTELTDQLEERIRNHWPRRGRVETEIKQPRVKELQSHKDKTYRLILSIQDKMIQLQDRFTSLLTESRSACDQYVQEMTSLRTALTGDFKNLAALQGLDVKARGTTLDFQADCNQRIQQLIHLNDAEINSIILYAQDFRRICPLQKPGEEGGYSESELEEIQLLMNDQCKDMEVIKGQWKEDLHQLEDLQKQSLLSQEEFNVKYTKCVQEVAMAEGLGQRYGAPRRRAQERIRTEVSRDERAAGKVDELLALIEFNCSETMSQIESGENKHQNSSSNNNNSHKTTTTTATVKVNGEKTRAKTSGIVRGPACVKHMQSLWLLMGTLRLALIGRAKFLDILRDKGFVEIAGSPLVWLDEKRLLSTVQTILGNESFEIASTYSIPTLEDTIIPGQPLPLPTIHAVFEEVSIQCKKETKELYQSEGLGATIPPSLEQWLEEAKEKLLGRHGYHERAWKRLWSQVQRLDQLLQRFRVENSKEGEDDHVESAAPQPVNPSEALIPLLPPTNTTMSSITSILKVSIQGVCLKALAEAHIVLARRYWKQQADQFSELLTIWEQGRDKHERLLKPRLSSPDKAEELSSLDNMEGERSQDMERGVISFRCLLIRGQIERFRQFCEDLSQISKGFLLILDSCLRQETLAVPPDTAIPTKHMTLKKLRKAQRIRDDVAKGKEDTSQRRLWPGLELSTETISIVTSAEDLVPDLGSQPSDTTGISGNTNDVTTEANTTSVPAGKGKDGKDKEKEKDKKAPPAKKGADKNAPPPVAARPSLLPTPWLERLKESSAVQGLVSSAHRLVIQHREESLMKYVNYVDACLQTVRQDYGLILQQEESWRQRWRRQVEMLRNGQV